MSEQEIREGLRVAVWDEPPLDFDPDALIERAEKVRSRRRALVSVGVGTALVVVSAFTLPMMFQSLRSDSANVADSPTRSAPPSAAPAGDQIDRISKRAVTRLQEVLPAAKDIGVSPIQYNLIGNGSQPPVPPTSKTDDGEPVSMYLTFEDGIGPTAIELRILDNPRFKQSCQESNPTSMCHEEAQPDGTKVMVSEHYQGGELFSVTVSHTRANGKIVLLSASAYNPTTGRGFRKTVPIGPGGLRVLATDPQISWD